jgi:hypothetical protein
MTTSVLGAPIFLALPLAFAYLGWGGGLVLFLASTVMSFYSGALLIELQDVLSHTTYSQVADSVMGRNWPKSWVRPFQVIVFVQVAIITILVVGPLGVCSAEMAAKAGDVLQLSSLASTVVNTGWKLPVSSTRLQYCHLVTGAIVAIAKLQPDYDKGMYPYFGYPGVHQGTTIRLECMRHWNPTEIMPATHVARSEVLRSDSQVGYLLVGSPVTWTALRRRFVPPSYVSWTPLL